MENLAPADCSCHKLMAVVTVHIEFGLIRLDSIPRLQRDLRGWLLQCSSFLGLSYTLPEIILQNNHGAK